MTVVLFATLVWQVVDFLRELANFQAQKSAVITQACAFAGGILVVWIGAHTASLDTFVLPGLNATLGGLDTGGTILGGLLVASLGSSLVDVKQALDKSDSAAKPPLIGP